MIYTRIIAYGCALVSSWRTYLLCGMALNGMIICLILHFTH